MLTLANIVNETSKSVTDRFGPEADHVTLLGTANALMVSRLLDLLVENKVVSETEREFEMRILYARIGVL